MNTNSRLIAELRDKAYRDAYVASQIEIGLPFQARALRQGRGWTQEKLAELAGMSQPRIAEIERPGKRKFNLDTLLRIASAFDVGLAVRFVPLSDIIDNSEAFDPDTFSVPTFEEELVEAEHRETVMAQIKGAMDKYIERIAASVVAAVPAYHAPHADLKPTNVFMRSALAGVKTPQRQRQLDLFRGQQQQREASTTFHIVPKTGTGAANAFDQRIMRVVSPAA